LLDWTVRDLAKATGVEFTNGKRPCDNDMDDLGNCAGCNRPLIEIDHYGERLIGCVRCNRWGWQPDKPFFMELPEEDIRAIREAARRG
jgi:hypothetical protein